MRYNILNANEITTVGNLANRQVIGGSRCGDAEMLRSESPRSERSRVQQPMQVLRPIQLQPKPSWYHCGLDQCQTALLGNLDPTANRRWAKVLKARGRTLLNTTFRFPSSSHLFCFDC